MNRLVSVYQSWKERELEEDREVEDERGGRKEREIIN